MANLFEDVRVLKNQVAKLNCEAGRHDWQPYNATSKDPKHPPYLKCSHCWKAPE